MCAIWHLGHLFYSAKKSKCGGWGLSAIGKCDKKVFRQIEIKMTVRVDVVHT